MNQEENIAGVQSGSDDYVDESLQLKRRGMDGDR